MIAVPTGTLAERLEQLADLHTRNARLCTPPFTGGRAMMEVALRHVAIHEQAAADCREAAALARRQTLSSTSRLSPQRLAGDTICRQSDHAFRPNEDGRCARCKGAQPPKGPFVGVITDAESDASHEWTGTCEKGAKCVGTRFLARYREGSWGGGDIRAGVFGAITAPDGRRWVIGKNGYDRDDWVSA